MARLGTQRVGDVLDYERDIKGKGLIRLRAGVGAGKNYWVRHLPEQYPKLQILMITSRKNTASAEACLRGTDCKIHLNELVDIEDKELVGGVDAALVICTNAYIAKFLENIYDPDNPSTHLWNKFDVIFVDEAHSISADATYADSSYHVERFIYHARKKNPRCDIVLMSGTPEPIDWLFGEDELGGCVNKDVYDECIHLVPDWVAMMQREVVAQRLYDLWSRGERVIYFSASVRNMSELIRQLQDLGVPECDMGVAYTNRENEEMLPERLVQEKEALRAHLISEQRIPGNVKIFITTAQNKEGISIIDDDIRYMFSESKNKAELEQMAGRVRGNPETGRGLHMLVVVYDAETLWGGDTFLAQELDRKLAEHVDEVLQQHEETRKAKRKPYSLSRDIKAIHEKYRYLRYDYIGQSVRFYTARANSEQQNWSDATDLAGYVAWFDDVLWYELREGIMYGITGKSLLKKEWFPYSKVTVSPGEEKSKMERATEELLSYLRERELLDVTLTEKQKAQVMAEIHRIIGDYGRRELGFQQLPKSMGPALRRFGMRLEWERHRPEKSKIVLVTREDTLDEL